MSNYKSITTVRGNYHGLEFIPSPTGTEIKVSMVHESPNDNMITVFTLSDLDKNILLGELIAHDALIKVHIILRKDIEVTPDILSILSAIGKISDIDQERAMKYRIITGMIPSSAIDTIRAIPEIKSVTLDGIKTI